MLDDMRELRDPSNATARLACGVDLDEIDRDFDAREELEDAADVVIAELRR